MPDIALTNGVMEEKCSVCNNTLTKFGSQPLKDGIACRKCVKEASEWLSANEYMSMTVEDFRNHLTYRKQNLSLADKFVKNKAVIGRYILFIDNVHNAFVFTKKEDLKEDNPDIISLESVDTIKITEKKYYNSDTYDVFLNVALKNCPFKDMKIRINDFPAIEKSSSDYKRAIDLAYAYLDTLVKEGAGMERIKDERK